MANSALSFPNVAGTRRIPFRGRSLLTRWLQRIATAAAEGRARDLTWQVVRRRWNDEVIAVSMPED